VLAQTAQGIGEALHEFGQQNPRTKWEQLALETIELQQELAAADHYIVRSEKSVDHWMHRCDKIKKAHEALLHKGLQTGDS